MAVNRAVPTPSPLYRARHATGVARKRVGLVANTVGSPRARVQQAKRGLKLAAFGLIAVVGLAFAAVKGVMFAAHHPFKMLKFLLLASVLPLYMLHHVEQSTSRFLHRTFSAAACSSPAPVPVGGVKGDAAFVGTRVHEFASKPVISPQAMKKILNGGANIAGKAIGEVIHVFESTLGGAPTPTEIPPPIPPSALVGFRGAAGCCPTGSDPGMLGAPGATVAFDITPGDSPAMAATRAASSAGFSGNNLLIAVAVAGAESSWQPAATNINTNGTTDYGEWQINSVHPEILATGNWQDIGANARMAFAIFTARGSWADWATFNSNRYTAWLPSAQQALNAVRGVAGPPVPLAEPAFNARVVAAPCTPILGGPGIVNFRPGAPAIETAIHFALAQLGKPYVFGATGPNAWDCSSLTQAAYRAAGVSLGRTTFEQIFNGVGIPVGSIQRGDLVFTDPDHVMIALGDGTAVEAPHTGDVVKIIPISAQLWAARRVAGIPATATAAA